MNKTDTYIMNETYHLVITQEEVHRVYAGPGGAPEFLKYGTQKLCRLLENN